MRHGKFVLAAVSLAMLLTACSDPVSPRPPDGGGDTPPPKTGFQQPQPNPLGVGITYA